MRVRLLPPNGEHSWTPYVWLIYLSLYVSYPVVVGVHGWRWLAHAAGLIAFLALYFRGFWVDGSQRLPILVAIVGLGVVLTPINPGASTFFIYASSFVGGARTGRAAAAWVAGITAVGAVTAWLQHWPPAITVATLALTPVIGAVNVNYAEMRRRDASLRLAQEEITRLGAIAERERIGRDLHDLLGHTLSVIVLKAELASKLMARDQARAAEELAEVERVSREALTEVRKAVHGFQNTSLGDEVVRARGLLETAGVRPYGELAASTGGQEALVAGLAPPVERALAFVLREAVTNVVRHARATRCRLSLLRDGDRVRLEVEDDGIGGETVDGSGLQGMRDRLREVNGWLERDGRKGTLIRATVPQSLRG